VLVGSVTARVEALDRGFSDILLGKRPQLAGYIMTLCVEPQYRDAGIGGELLKKILFMLYQESCATTYLHVLATNNNAIRFYKKRGFCTTKFHDGFYHINSTYQDAYEMAFSFPDTQVKDEVDLINIMIPSTKSDLKHELIENPGNSGSLLMMSFVILVLFIFLPFRLFWNKLVNQLQIRFSAWSRYSITCAFGVSVCAFEVYVCDS